jgi:hypothetical protein
VSRRFSDFLVASSFLYSNNCSRSVLAKKLAALHANGRSKDDYAAPERACSKAACAVPEAF